MGWYVLQVLGNLQSVVLASAFTDRASLTGLGLVVLQVLGSLQSVVLGSTVTDRVSLTGLGSIRWVGRHLFELPNNCEL